MLITQGTKFFQAFQFWLGVFFARNYANVFFRDTVKKSGKCAISVLFRLFFLRLQCSMVNSNRIAIPLQHFIFYFCKVSTKYGQKRFFCPVTIFRCAAFIFFFKSRLCAVFFLSRRITEKIFSGAFFDFFNVIYQAFGKHNVNVRMSLFF